MKHIKVLIRDYSKTTLNVLFGVFLGWCIGSGVAAIIYLLLPLGHIIHLFAVFNIVFMALGLWYGLEVEDNFVEDYKHEK